MADKPRKEPGTGEKLLLDLAPLIIFFAVNVWSDIIAATIAFMIAISSAMLVSRIRYGSISPMLWISGVMVIVLGTITVWRHDQTFIKIKPTIYYSVIAALLLFGMCTKRNLLKTVLGSTYPGLSDRGWQLLTRNWIFFFVVMAVVNEAVWRTAEATWGDQQGTDFWVGFKLWGALPATLLFAGANIPMLMRHGLQLEKPAEETPVPPVQ